MELNHCQFYLGLISSEVRRTNIRLQSVFGEAVSSVSFVLANGFPWVRRPVDDPVLADDYPSILPFAIILDLQSHPDFGKLLGNVRNLRDDTSFKMTLLIHISVFVSDHFNAGSGRSCDCQP